MMPLDSFDQLEVLRSDLMLARAELAEAMALIERLTTERDRARVGAQAARELARVLLNSTPPDNEARDAARAARNMLATIIGAARKAGQELRIFNE